LYLEFLLLVRDKKENRNFNHMENNVFVGLKDIPTLTELCVLSLYSQAISDPYMRRVRGSGERRMNALDAGPLHDQVKAHIANLIDTPELLLANDCSYTLGSLDGQVWERPEAIYAIHCIKDSLPHLNDCLVAFLRGTLETWNRFTSEFADGGVIAELSRDEKDSLWIDTTNDVNEGALGTTRQSFHRAPNISLPKINSRMMYRKNDTNSFIRHVFNTPADQAFLRSQARKQDASGLPQKSMQEEILHDKAEVSRKRTNDITKKAAADAKSSILDALLLELDVETLKNGLKSAGKKITVVDLRLQIAWHRRHDKHIGSKTKINELNKDGLLRELITIIKRLPDDFCADDYRNIHPPQAAGVFRTLEWDEVEDREDADMMEG
jgi:hypothetical protein